MNPLASNSVGELDSASNNQGTGSSKPTYASILAQQDSHAAAAAAAAAVQQIITNQQSQQQQQQVNGAAVAANKLVANQLRKYSAAGIDSQPPFMNSSVLSEISCCQEQPSDLSINLDDSKFQLIAAANVLAAAAGMANMSQIIVSLVSLTNFIIYVFFHLIFSTLSPC